MGWDPAWFDERCNHGEDAKSANLSSPLVVVQVLSRPSLGDDDDVRTQDVAEAERASHRERKKEDYHGALYHAAVSGRSWIHPFAVPCSAEKAWGSFGGTLLADRPGGFAQTRAKSQIFLLSVLQSKYPASPSWLPRRPTSY